MTCAECRDLLLESGPADLEDALASTGRSPDPAFAAHLRGCDDCRAAARAILADHRALVAALSAVEAATEARGGRPAPTPGAARRMPAVRAGTRGLRRTGAVGLAAAAAIAPLLVRGEDVEEAPRDPSPEALYAALGPPRPVVETEPGVRSAVIETDHEVTLVLLYPGGSER